MNWTFLPARELARHRAAWAALNDSHRRSPLLDPDFIEPLLELQPEAHPILAILGEPASPQAMLLLTRTGFGRWASYLPSQMPITALVTRPEWDAVKLIESLRRALPGVVLSIDLLQLDPQFDPAPSADTHIYTLDYIETARIVIDQPFDTYWAARSRNLRHNLNRQRNRFERDGITLTMKCISDPASVREAISEYGRLESSGWKAGGGTAVAADNAQGRFYCEVLERFCRRGQGRIYQLYYGDRLATIDVCIIHKQTLIVLKTTYDETIEGSSPAMLMRQTYLEELFADPAVHIIEFYGRAMDWHRRLSDDLRTIYHLGYQRWPQLRRLVHWLRDARRATPPAVETVEHAEIAR